MTSVSTHGNKCEVRGYMAIYGKVGDGAPPRGPVTRPTSRLSAKFIFYSRRACRPNLFFIPVAPVGQIYFLFPAKFFPGQKFGIRE